MYPLMAVESGDTRQLVRWSVSSLCIEETQKRRYWSVLCPLFEGPIRGKEASKSDHSNRISLHSHWCVLGGSTLILTKSCTGCREPPEMVLLFHQKVLHFIKSFFCNSFRPDGHLNYLFMQDFPKDRMRMREFYLYLEMKLRTWMLGNIVVDTTGKFPHLV